MRDRVPLLGFGRDWRLMLGAQWTGWHSFDEVRVGFADGGSDLIEVHD